MPHFPPRSCFSPILCCYRSLCPGDPRLPRPTACCLGTEPQLQAPQALQAAPQLSADPSGDGGRLGGGLHPHPLQAALQRGQLLLRGQGQLAKDEGAKGSDQVETPVGHKAPSPHPRTCSRRGVVPLSCSGLGVHNLLAMGGCGGPSDVGLAGCGSARARIRVRVKLGLPIGVRAFPAPPHGLNPITASPIQTPGPRRPNPPPIIHWRSLYLSTRVTPQIKHRVEDGAPLSRPPPPPPTSGPASRGSSSRFRADFPPRSPPGVSASISRRLRFLPAIRGTAGAALRVGVRGDAGGGETAPWFRGSGGATRAALSPRAPCLAGRLTAALVRPKKSVRRSCAIPAAGSPPTVPLRAAARAR